VKGSAGYKGGREGSVGDDAPHSLKKEKTTRGGGWTSEKISSI